MTQNGSESFFHRSIFRVACLGLVVACGGARDLCGAEMYQWTDSDGRVHYSDTAPGSVTEGVTRFSVEGAPPPGTGPMAPQDENPGVEALDRASREREERTEEARAKAREKRAAEAARSAREQCDKARAVVALLEDHRNGILYRRDPDRPDLTSGSRLTRFEIQDEIEKWQKAVAEQCTGDEGAQGKTLDAKELPFAVPAQ